MEREGEGEDVGGHVCGEGEWVAGWVYTPVMSATLLSSTTGEACA
jgi:hypothetical protein